MIKKSIVLSLFAALCAVVMPATTLAAATADISCLKSAVETRETALGAGWDTFSSAVKDAYAARKTALSAAYATSASAEIKTSVRAAWKVFKSSTKSARSALKKTRADAWKTFKASSKACSVTEELQDTSNSSADNSI